MTGAMSSCSGVSCTHVGLTDSGCGDLLACDGIPVTKDLQRLVGDGLPRLGKGHEVVDNSGRDDLLLQALKQRRRRQDMTTMSMEMHVTCVM